MRAGTLSDTRVLALLQRHFVCVHLPELCTKDLIADPEDLALLERLHRDALARRGGDGLGWPGFFGGEREAFLTPDGELVDMFLSLNVGTKEQRQYTPAARARPDAAVERFFRAARAVLQRVHGEVPEDLEALRDGTHPDVASRAAAAIPTPPPAPAGVQRLRVWVRNDLVMYESLVGHNLLDLDATQARALLPEKPAPQARQEWPRAAVLRLARAAYPRAAGVLLEVRDESIDGSVTSEVLAVHGDTVRGTFRGALRLSAERLEERGRRDSYRPFRGADAELAGDFEFDLAKGCFTSLRLVSTSGSGRFQHHPKVESLPYAIGVELLPDG
ncbi:MAG: hypothetical protein IT458_16115 [Planctomycetes bacterium]|nr:hypothetical protein [Planctomycetota bacterium]